MKRISFALGHIVSLMLFPCHDISLIESGYINN